ncbi:MAG: flagellar basal body rod protein FlgB [Candidatus Hydrogenedentes bacterium]|nr:flagellar basal body rod protein FlgB [Candidatus Hydrogenedentota bacterium]
MAFAGVDTVSLLTAGMKVAVRNQSLIANNIANVDTPKYNPARLDFQASLRDALEGRGPVALRTTMARHLDATREMPRFERLALSSKNDYNKVDLEQEMADLAENTGKYTTYSSLLAKHFRMVKDMLSGLR